MYHKVFDVVQSRLLHLLLLNVWRQLSYRLRRYLPLLTGRSRQPACSCMLVAYLFQQPHLYTTAHKDQERRSDIITWERSRGGNVVPPWAVETSCGDTPIARHRRSCVPPDAPRRPRARGHTMCNPFPTSYHAAGFFRQDFRRIPTRLHPSTQLDQRLNSQRKAC
ncbi:hypothetical protein BDV95DRAFT_583185 [Massariosphaeria phaeospora]|uniref:Uncharacterized protein n=1 Tax=Massariosphaeria phaeospora TaxID=100035 RepID=A0A7C8I025_9PLEO|nr:hypothetical protein BDV95DRAFT_583185 [Massariosphaeria phaeospora]